MRRSRMLSSLVAVIMTSAGLCLGAIGPASADSVGTFTIDARYDIFDAGHLSPPLGDQPPLAIPLRPGSDGEAVVFSNSSGGVTQGVNEPSPGPDGGYDPDLAMNINSFHGISGIVADPGHGGFLAAVFTDMTEPADPAPPRLDYSSSSGSVRVTQPDLHPALDQLFFVGDGLTGTGSGTQQQFVVPAGATTLWLGLADAGYYQGDPIPGTGSAGSYTTTVGLQSYKSSSFAYVAMGDSYSSGEGAANRFFDPTTSFPDPKTDGTTGCHRSTRAYEVHVAAVAGFAASQTGFVACSGAQVEDFYQPNVQYRDFGETEGAQLLAITRDTRLVTLTIGGNDLGFATVLNDCVYDLVHVHGSPGCSNPSRTAYVTAESGLDKLANGIPVGTTTMTLRDVYVSIASRMALNGTIVVAGYPRLFGQNRAHYAVDPFSHRQACSLAVAKHKDPVLVALGDAKWLNTVADRANQIIHDQVTQADLAVRPFGIRVLYTETLDKQFHGHRFCDGKSAWFNPPIFHGTNTKPDQRSFHPTQSGQDAYSAVIVATLAHR